MSELFLPNFHCKPCQILRSSIYLELNLETLRHPLFIFNSAGTAFVTGSSSLRLFFILLRDPCLSPLSRMTSVHAYPCMSCGKQRLVPLKGSLERKGNQTSTSISFQGMSPSPLPGTLGQAKKLISTLLIQISIFFMSNILLSLSQLCTPVVVSMVPSPQFLP